MQHLLSGRAQHLYNVRRQWLRSISRISATTANCFAANSPTAGPPIIAASNYSLCE
jgi:hypothetical protein